MWTANGEHALQSNVIASRGKGILRFIPWRGCPNHPSTPPTRQRRRLDEVGARLARPSSRAFRSESAPSPDVHGIHPPPAEHLPRHPGTQKTCQARQRQREEPVEAPRIPHLGRDQELLQEQQHQSLEASRTFVNTIRGVGTRGWHVERRAARQASCHAHAPYHLWGGRLLPPPSPPASPVSTLPLQPTHTACRFPGPEERNTSISISKERLPGTPGRDRATRRISQSPSARSPPTPKRNKREPVSSTRDSSTELGGTYGWFHLKTAPNETWRPGSAAIPAIRPSDSANRRTHHRTTCGVLGKQRAESGGKRHGRRVRRPFGTLLSYPPLS